MSPPPLGYLIDAAEPRWLKDGLGHQVSPLYVRRLPAGDVWIGHPDATGTVPTVIPTVIVERKTVSDFLSSMLKDPTHYSHDSKINRQLEQCQAAAPYTVLLLEGTWSTTPDDRLVTSGKRNSGWHVNSFLGKLVSLQIRHPGLILLSSPTRATTVTILVGLSKLAW